MQQATSINEIRTAIRELLVRAELAHRKAARTRNEQAAEIERRIASYREELSQRP
jgi:hypothetical protein